MPAPPHGLSGLSLLSTTDENTSAQAAATLAAIAHLPGSSSLLLPNPNASASGSGSTPPHQNNASASAIAISSSNAHSSCPPPTGKIRNQYNLRKSVQEALDDCLTDDALRQVVLKCVECSEYREGKAVPGGLLIALFETVGVRSQTRCRFPACGKMNVRTDRAKEHARSHIGNHPFPCTRIQVDGAVGWCVLPLSFWDRDGSLMFVSSGATFLRKHDRNRHDSGADLLTCEAWCVGRLSTILSTYLYSSSGAHIQGKGREYNLQRHRLNYCPVSKTQPPIAEDGEGGEEVGDAELSGDAAETAAAGDIKPPPDLNVGIDPNLPPHPQEGLMPPATIVLNPSSSTPSISTPAATKPGRRGGKGKATSTATAASVAPKRVRAPRRSKAPTSAAAGAEPLASAPAPPLIDPMSHPNPWSDVEMQMNLLRANAAAGTNGMITPIVPPVAAMYHTHPHATAEMYGMHHHHHQVHHGHQHHQHHHHHGHDVGMVGDMDGEGEEEEDED